MLIRYLGVAVCARLADEGARVAILLLALDRTDDAALGGLLIAALMVPHVLAAPLAGAAADRARRRRLLYATTFLAYAASLLAATALIGRNTAAAVAVLVLAGCFAPLLIGGLTSLLGELAGDRLDRAFGFDVMSYAISGIAGPALAAVLAGVAGPAWSLAGLAALVIVAAALVTTLPLAPREPAARPQRGHPLAALLVMWRRPRLGATTAGNVLGQAGIGALPLVAALLAGQAGRTELTGVILSAGGVGGLAGSLLCTRWPIRRWAPETVVFAGLAASGIPFLLLALLAGAWSDLRPAVLAASLVLVAAVGGFGSPMVVGVFAVRDRESPSAIRTQVFTIGAGLKVTAAAAGAAIAGLAAPAGAAALLLGIAVCQFVGAVIVIITCRVAPATAPSIVSQAN